MKCYVKYVGLTLLLATTAAAQSPGASDGIRPGYRAFSFVLKDGGASAQTVKPLNRVDLIVTVHEPGVHITDEDIQKRMEAIKWSKGGLPPLKASGGR